MDILKVKQNGVWTTIPAIIGPRGIGITSITKTGTNGLTDTYTITFSDNTTTTFALNNGATPNLTIGTVTEGATAAATITGTSAAPILNLVLPNANVPTRVSQLENDSHYAVDANYVHTDNNYTNDEKIKLSTIAAGAEVNVNADWNAVSGDAQILNKPTNVSDFTNDAGYLTQHQDISGKADKTDTVLETTLSRGRTINSEVGTGSFAFGDDVTASGGYSHAEGRHTVANHQGAHAEGLRTTASYGAHAEGENTVAKGQWSHAEGCGSKANGAASYAGGKNTIANGTSSHVFGEINVEDSYDNWPFWTANTAYNVGDRVKRIQTINNEDTIIGYICKEANNDATFTIAHWNFDSNHMNYVEIVGNGTIGEDPTTHEEIRNGVNIRALDWYGNEHLKGDLYVHSNADSTGGNKVLVAADIVGKQDVLTFDSTPTTASSNPVTSAGIKSYVDTAVSNINTMRIHICTVQEYNSETGIPTIQTPDTQTFYLVPGGESSNLYIEWVYVNNAWERFGSADVDLSDYATKSEVPDVQIDGTSIVTNNVANIPIGSTTTTGDLGVVKSGAGVKISAEGNLYISAAQAEDIKAGESGIYPIAPNRQHNSVFYGLAKAAGDSTQASSSNAVGTYTDAAKTAIRTMLDVPAVSDIPTIPVTDVQVNGSSVVSSGIANVPIATSAAAGVVKVNSTKGININSGTLGLSEAGSLNIQQGTTRDYAVTPFYQHSAAFYGLSKAAGADLSSTSNVIVGTYPDTSKAAIQSMLGIDALLAPKESDLLADVAYAAGELFMLNGKLHKATAAISEGGAIDVGVNCEVVKASEVFPHDVQVNGTSVVSNGVANVPVAAESVLGTVKVADGTHGIGNNNGLLHIVNASSMMKAGTSAWRPIVPSIQHEAVFYGLAKAAGADLASAENITVGTYPDATKAAIRSMLGATSPDIVAIQAATPTSTDTKVWIPNSTPTITTVPTYAEFTAGLAEKAPVGLGITGTTAGQFIKVNTVDANGVPLTYAAEPMKYTLTVTAVTQDNITVSGQTVTVRDTDANGQIYGTATYSGQPVSFALPVGFSYYVSISDTLEHHFNPTTASGIITNTNVSVTLTYSDFSSIRTAADIKAALNADMDLTDLVGETISCSKGSNTLVWDVVDYDSTNKRITLLLHDAFGSANMVFEPVQALMWCENGLAAGNYTFKWSSTQVYFTLTTAIPAGGQLRATNSAFSTYESQSATATLETGTVSTTEITGATDLGTTGQGLLNHHDRVSYGSNNYKESALLWWLNSDAAANTLRVPVTKFSRAYSYNVAGFLNGLDASFVSCLDDTVWKCSTNNVYECPASLGGATPGKTQTYTVTAKIGLASEMEIFGSYGGNADGSTIFDLYNGATADDRKKYRGTTAQVWWLRSPGWYYSDGERGVSSSGGAGNTGAYGSCAVVLATKISKTTL